MKADEFVRRVQEQNEKSWRNSDIPEKGETLLRDIAQIFENCPDCRREFDEQGGFDGTLQDFADEYGHTNLEDWTCPH